MISNVQQCKSYLYITRRRKVHLGKSLFAVVGNHLRPFASSGFGLAVDDDLVFNLFHLHLVTKKHPLVKEIHTADKHAGVLAFRHYILSKFRKRKVFEYRKLSPTRRMKPHISIGFYHSRGFHIISVWPLCGKIVRTTMTMIGIKQLVLRRIGLPRLIGSHILIYCTSFSLPTVVCTSKRNSFIGVYTLCASTTNTVNNDSSDSNIVFFILFVDFPTIILIINLSHS